MSKFSDEFLHQLGVSKVVPVFSVENAEHGPPVVNALVAGGLKTVELTLRTSAAMEALAAICTEVPDAIVGVGTILTVEQVREAKRLGAAFGVAPGLNPVVVKEASSVGLPFIPGVATPTELEQAMELGCKVIKFFPAESLGGVGYLKSMSAPYKHLGVQFMPTGGVRENNMHHYLELSNVVAVGGTFIVNQQMVTDENWDGITNVAKSVCSALSANSTV